MSDLGAQDQPISERAKQARNSIASTFEEVRRLSDARAVSVLNREDRDLIVRLLPRLVRVRVWLAMLDYPATREKIEARFIAAPPGSPPEASEVRHALRAGRIINGLGRRMPFASECLVRSLAVWWLLRDDAIPAELRIGVKKDDDFEAHAWVDVCGQPITDTPEKIAAFGAFDRSSR